MVRQNDFFVEYYSSYRRMEMDLHPPGVNMKCGYIWNYLAPLISIMEHDFGKNLGHRCWKTVQFRRSYHWGWLSKIFHIN